MQTSVRVLLTVVVLAVAGFLSYDMGLYYLYSPWTRDARVRADVITVTPDVSGYVTEVRVRNDQLVRKGDVLFAIDAARYRIALSDAEATAAARVAQHQMLLHQYERRSKLTTLSVAPEALENALRQSETAAAQYQQAFASRDLAKLNLERTTVRAAVNGYVTNLNVSTGNYVSSAKPVLALIDRDSYRVDAYFEETKIPQIRLGAPVEVHLMSGAGTLKGTVQSIARGITDQDNRDGPELLASVNPTFSWVRLAQRIPVRVRLTEVPPDTLISAGMTCTVALTESASPPLGAGFNRLVAALRRAPST
jgi:multidrug resistance efflux pump